MRSAPNALINLLNSNTQFLMADLYTITVLSGDVLRWTSADFNLAVDGNVYAPQGQGGVPIITRSRWSNSAGLDVDELDLILDCGDSAMILGLPAVLQAYSGLFDGATIVLDRGFFTSWTDTSVGSLNLFTGTTGELDVTSTSVEIHAKSFVNLLNVQMPRNQFLPICSHLLYDAGCTMLKANFTNAYTAASGATTSVIAASAATGKPAGYYETGILTYAGSRRGVRSFDGTTFTLMTPLAAAPAQGDSFTVQAGCDRTLATCTSRFANQVNWRGFKDIPPAENAV